MLSFLKTFPLHDILCIYCNPLCEFQGNPLCFQAISPDEVLLQWELKESHSLYPLNILHIVCGQCAHAVFSITLQRSKSFWEWEYPPKYLFRLMKKTPKLLCLRGYLKGFCPPASRKTATRRQKPTQYRQLSFPMRWSLQHNFSSCTKNLAFAWWFCFVMVVFCAWPWVKR